MNAIREQLDLVARQIEVKDFESATKSAQALTAMLELAQLQAARCKSAINTSKEKGELTTNELKEVLRYEPETGHFYWRQRGVGRRRVDAPAGSISKDGYVVISFGYKAYKAHRLAWLYMHGKWPSGVIDHINGNPGDNRITNLRDTSQISNAQNRRKTSANNKSGVIGVRQDGSRWRAQITAGGKTVQLGTFDTVEAAVEARAKAQSRIHIGSVL